MLTLLSGLSLISAVANDFAPPPSHQPSTLQQTLHPIERLSVPSIALRSWLRIQRHPDQAVIPIYSPPPGVCPHCLANGKSMIRVMVSSRLQIWTGSRRLPSQGSTGSSKCVCQERGFFRRPTTAVPVSRVKGRGEQWWRSLRESATICGLSKSL